MGIIDFAKHVYSYFISESNDDPNVTRQLPPIVANTGVNPFPGNFNSLVPVIGASGDVVYYIEKPIVTNKPGLINAPPIDKPVIPIHPNHLSTLYKRLPDGQYVPVLENPPAVPPTEANPIKPPKPQLLAQAPPSTVPVPIPSTGKAFVWDGWPDGNLIYDLDLMQVKETGKLQVHWAITTSGGYGGSKEANCWEEGSKRSTRCLGVIECDNPTCQIITRPHVKPARIAAQLGKPCRCGGNLVRNECNVMSYLWHWSGGIHYENKGHHLHRRPTHLLHLLPGERTSFEELVSSHPKSGPLQLVIGVPGLRGPGKSAAEISDVLLNAHRVGKERSKIIKGETIGTIDKLIASFAKFDTENPNVVLHSTFGTETVISLQTPFMRSQLVKDNRLEEPINGIVSDATHNWWISDNSLLIISSTYCPVLMCWVPGILTYSNGGTTNHFHHHFYALVRSIALEAEARNIPVTKELFAGMMDFSEAECGGFIQGYITYFLQRPDNTFTRQELHLIAERLLKGCREHFRASIERISKMLHVIPRDSKDDFTRRANDLVYLPSTEKFLEEAALLVRDFPNIKDWMEWWTRPAHARMLFESQRDMDAGLWKSLPDTNNAEEAMNWKLYQGCGRDHHFLEGMYALLKVAHHYEAQFKAASTGVPIRYGQAEPWKGVAEKQGHTKPSRAKNSQDVKRKKNDGRPPDTAKELVKSTTETNTKKLTKMATQAPISQLTFGPPSYQWKANSCWLDTSLQLLFVCVLQSFEEFSSLFDGISEETVLYGFFNVLKMRYEIGKEVPDDVASRKLVEHRDTFREALCNFGSIEDTESSQSFIGWLYNILNRSFPMAAYPSIHYFNTWYMDTHSCSGSPDWGDHIEIVQPRRSPELQLSDSHHEQYKGSFKDYFRDRLRIDRKPTPAMTCWRVKDGVPLCPGVREDVKDLILSIPVIMSVEIGIENPGQPCTWDFPETLYPHTQPSGKTHGLVYDLVGLALLNPSIRHFIACYASEDQKTIYTYDGMAHGGYPKKEPKAKFRGYIGGKNINVPKGYCVYQVFYVLRGGLSAQEEFFKIRTAALTRRFHFVFGPGSVPRIPSVRFPSKFRGLQQLPHPDRIGWTTRETTVEYVSKLSPPSTQPNTEDVPEEPNRKESSNVTDRADQIPVDTPQLPPPPPPPEESPTQTSVPDSLFSLNCRCGLRGDGNDIYDPMYGMAIQCIECRDWSHVACQREGRASNLSHRKKDEFTCDFCSLQGILPPKTDAPKRDKRHTKYQKPLQKRLLPGLGALAKHRDFWYPVRLMHYNQASKTWNVLWWRACSFPLLDIVPGTVTEVQESQIVDALWQDRTARRQIRLGKWVHAIEVITDEDILADPSYTKYTEEIDEILSKSRRILTQLMLTPKSVQNIDEVPALKWLKAKRKPLSDIVPFAGDLSIKERSQISNWFEAKIAAGNENRRYRWLGLVPLAHAFTLYILGKLDVETLDTMDRNSDKENGDNMMDDSTSNKRVQTPLERAWYIQTHPGPGVMWNNIDVDKDCLSILEYDMFERSQIAGIAGNWQWGLDAGDHQENWNPYEGMYSDWFVSNRDSESESERQRGYYYITIGEGESEREIGTRTPTKAQRHQGKAQGSRKAQKKATQPVKK